MSKLTDWYPPDIKPVHTGRYPSRVRFGHGVFGKILTHTYWDGRCWRFNGLRGGVCLFQNRYWRGLAQKPRKAK